jgi:hypothetical protein
MRREGHWAHIRVDVVASVNLFGIQKSAPHQQPPSCRPRRDRLAPPCNGRSLRRRNPLLSINELGKLTRRRLWVGLLVFSD